MYGVMKHDPTLVLEELPKELCSSFYGTGSKTALNAEKLEKMNIEYVVADNFSGVTCKDETTGKYGTITLDEQNNFACSPLEKEIEKPYVGVRLVPEEKE